MSIPHLCHYLLATSHQTLVKQLRTTSSSKTICSLMRTALCCASLSARRFPSSACCFCMRSCCRFSISCRRLCCELLGPWLSVFSNPPNKRFPRFLSSCVATGGRLSGAGSSKIARSLRCERERRLERSRSSSSESYRDRFGMSSRSSGSGDALRFNGCVSLESVISIAPSVLVCLSASSMLSKSSQKEPLPTICDQLYSRIW